MSWTHVPLASVILEARPGFASGEDLDDGLFQIRMNNITREGSLDLNRRRRVGAEGRKMESLLLKPGDVLFNATNSPDLVGKSAHIDSIDEATTYSNHFIRLRTDPLRLNALYLSQWLHRQFQSGKFKGLCKQWVNQASISKDALLGLKIPLPPLPEQSRIAAILDKAHALRAKRRAALAELDGLVQAIFLEMFGDPSLNPNGYPKLRLGDLAAKFSDGPFGSNLKSSHYSETGVRVIRLQNIGVGELLDDDKAFITENHFTTLKKHECLPGDVLVGTLGDPNLRACIQPTSLARALNKADCVQIRPNPAIASADFICALLNHPSVERMAQDKIVGQTRLRIAMGRLRELTVPTPPLDLQQQFAARVGSVSAVRRGYIQALIQHDALFTSLQHRAFRGEL